MVLIDFCGSLAPVACNFSDFVRLYALRQAG
jgi:hypothetical protein